MFSDTLDNSKFNIELLEKGKFLNFSWNGECPEMSLYDGHEKLESFSFDNELFMKHFINMYFDEDFFLKSDTEKGLAKGLYKTDHKKNDMLNKPYMSRSFDMHLEDMNENSVYIICSREDYTKPYRLIMNDTEVGVDAMIIRKIRFCVGYLETAQFHYEKQLLVTEREDT